MNRLSFALLMQIYHSAIVPVVLFGLKGSALAQRNRNSLDRMEPYMVSKFKSLSRDPPASNKVLQLLKGRTIGRKCTVHRLNNWGHIVRRPDRHILKRALRYRIGEKFKRCRPCLTWRRCENGGLETTMHDRAKHNAKCEELYVRGIFDEDYESDG